MKNKPQTIVLTVALALVAAFVFFGQARPAQAHDADGHGCACSGGAVLLPPTDNEEVARIYATTAIVTAYIEAENGAASQANITQMVGQVHDALD